MSHERVEIFFEQYFVMGFGLIVKGIGYKKKDIRKYSSKNVRLIYVEWSG